MTPYEHIDYIADNGIIEWLLCGIAWLRDCAWECVCGAVLIVLALACVACEMYFRWRDRVAK